MVCGVRWYSKKVYFNRVWWGRMVNLGINGGAEVSDLGKVRVNLMFNRGELSDLSDFVLN